MNKHSTMRAGWRSMWTFSCHHEAPLWAQLLLTSSAAVMLALGLMGVTSVFGTVDYSNWFRA